MDFRKMVQNDSPTDYQPLNAPLRSAKQSFHCCCFHFRIPVELRSIIFQYYCGCVPHDNTTLGDAVQIWFEDRLQCVLKYGFISDWGTSQVTDMSRLFRGREHFNEDISAWDTANVAHMSEMFCGAAAFNQPLQCWNVQKVTHMNRMFQHASSFNQSLESWNLESLTSHFQMFQGASSFNQPRSKQKLEIAANRLPPIETFADISASVSDISLSFLSLLCDYVWFKRSCLLHLSRYWW
jgi:surface protein